MDCYLHKIMDIKNFFENRSILVTGGTGTIGSEIVKQLLKYNPKTIRILSNSENELWETQLRFKQFDNKLRFLLGDIRNRDRVNRAMRDIDYVFNAAAVKHVPISEYNPIEAITVNIEGVNNVIEAAFKNNVKKVVHISTDKAVLPTTVMGATKMLAERVCVSKSRTKGKSGLVISCVRFGNVLGSRGSIIPLIKAQIEKGDNVTLTGREMRRFFMSVDDAVNLVLKSMILARGGEIFVLKMPTVEIKTLIEVIIEEYAPKIGKDPHSIKIIDKGPRIGEKFDEELISPIEYLSCYETDNSYIIYPKTDISNIEIENIDLFDGTLKKLDQNFLYNTKFQKPLEKQEIKKLLHDLELL